MDVFSEDDGNEAAEAGSTYTYINIFFLSF